jgi:hypothetical protein
LLGPPPVALLPRRSYCVRSFPLGGERRLQFRAEAFNVLNTVQYNNPVSALNNGNFGLITSAADARVIQLALKYTL